MYAVVLKGLKQACVYTARVAYDDHRVKFRIGDPALDIADTSVADAAQLRKLFPGVVFLLPMTADYCAEFFMIRQNFHLSNIY